MEPTNNDIDAPIEPTKETVLSDDTGSIASNNVSQPTTENPAAPFNSASQTPPYQQVAPPVIMQQNAQSKNKKKIILILIGAILLLLSGVVGLYAFNRSTKTADEATPTANSTAPTPDSTEIAAEYSYDIDVVNPKFSGDIVELAYQPIYTDEQLRANGGTEQSIESLQENTSFYQLGTLSGGQPIIISTGFFFDSGYLYFIKDGDTYVKINNTDEEFENGRYTGTQFAPTVKIAKNITVALPEVKDFISYEGITASKVSIGAQILSEEVTEGLTEVAKIDEGIIYERVSENTYHPGIKQFSILLKQPTGMYVIYRYATPILNDDNSLTVNWNDNSKTTEQYSWAIITNGCGQIDAVNVLDKANFNDVKEAGSANGQTVYEFKSSDNAVLKTIYDNYNHDGTREGAVSLQEFYDNHGVIVVRNELGYRVILVNSKYGGQGECGKPVIYLYPQEVTDISVKVGANITVSIPDYNQGWNVTAYPDGTLINDGAQYPYLFWEGQGNGLYPEITEGFVVKSSVVEETLKSHLTALGLNDKESADFMEFWLPLMPDTPYTRLTWLGTSAMNELAPLTLSKEPDTLIRVFLDFEGLQQPISLKKQILTHPKREGFVVVEWGGLRYVY